MKPKSLIALVLGSGVIAIAAFGLTASGGAKTAKLPVTGGTAITVRHTALGQTLVDANGRTLYLFEADRHNVSTLSPAGRAVWPPLTAIGTVTAGGTAQAAKIGTTAGPSGQVTYNGHPLYYYIGDTATGGTKGQHLKEFGAVWFALAPSGRAITSAAVRSAAPAPASSGAYGY